MSDKDLIRHITGARKRQNTISGPGDMQAIWERGVVPVEIARKLIPLGEPCEVYVFVGDQMFVHEEYTGSIQGLEHPKSLFYMSGELEHGFYGALTSYKGSMSESVAITLWGLQNVNVTGQRVLELGSADALPGLTCARRGARVHAVDYEKSHYRTLERNLRANNIPRGSLEFSHEDITDLDIMSRLPSRDVSIVIANLGRTYGELSDEASAEHGALRIIESLPDVKTVIGAGHTTYTGKDGSFRQHSHHLNMILGRLGRIGFQKIDLLYGEKGMSFMGCDNPTYLRFSGFIASRK